MAVLKDIQNNKKNMDAMGTYYKFNKDMVKVDYKQQPIKPMKSTTNLLLNMKISSLKNAQIMGSNNQKPSMIRPYNKFKGAEALPTFKKDLKSWHIC